MSRRDEEQLAAAWISPEVAEAISSVAASEGVTKSDVIRDGLVVRLLSFAQTSDAGESNRERP